MLRRMGYKQDGAKGWCLGVALSCLSAGAVEMPGTYHPSRSRGPDAVSQHFAQHRNASFCLGMRIDFCMSSIMVSTACILMNRFERY